MEDSFDYLLGIVCWRLQGSFCCVSLRIVFLPLPLWEDKTAAYNNGFIASKNKKRKSI